MGRWAARLTSPIRTGTTGVDRGLKCEAEQSEEYTTTPHTEARGKGLEDVVPEMR